MPPGAILTHEHRADLPTGNQTRYSLSLAIQGGNAIKPEITASDSLSYRIFRDDAPNDILSPATSLSSLRAELKTLQKKNQKLQQNLRLSSGLRQRFESLYDASPMGLLTIDADGLITEANLTVAQFLQIKRPQLIGQPLKKFIAPEDHTTLYDHLTQLREQISQPSHPMHCRLHLIHSPDSKPIEVHLESLPLPNSLSSGLTMISIKLLPVTHETSPQSYVGPPLINPPLRHDANKPELNKQSLNESGLTDRIEHPQGLAHAARLNMVGDMAAGMAHEINQPLAAITNYTQSCLRLIGGNAEQQAQVPGILNRINTQAQRAASIIKHLRDFVIKGESHRKATELAKLVRFTLSMMRSDFINQHIKLNIKAPTSLPLIAADPIQIEQVILNLLRNASEAMNEVDADARHLRITLDRLSDTHVSVAISDTGPGIHDDHSEMIPTPFFSTKENGMGLGLAISRTIVEDHGGQLTHTNNAEGGTTFTISLAIDGKREKLD